MQCVWLTSLTAILDSISRHEFYEVLNNKKFPITVKIPPADLFQAIVYKSTDNKKKWRQT